MEVSVKFHNYHRFILERGNDLFSPAYPRGGRCCFIPIDDKWAVKVYKEAYQRDKAFSNQRKAAVYGLGPEVGPYFNVIVVGTHYYCYVTEIVETVYPGCYYHDWNDYVHSQQGKDSWSDFDDTASQLNDDLCDEANDLYSELYEKIGFEFGDSFSGNWGWKNGKLICIDFE